ncbi:hypothetical protein ACOMHN_059840 [Nucella lapillus]
MALWSWNMADDFVISGTRPPSVAGLRPSTATSKDFGYFTKNTRSTVDETLFQPHHSSALNAPVTFSSTPWGEKKLKGGGKDVQKKPKPVPPLFWAPAASQTRFSIHGKQTSHRDDSVADSSSTFGTLQGIPLKHQYHPIKHTPTFVDETLFGKPLMEPSFKAPWEEKKKVKAYNWYQGQQEERKPVRKRRPATALGVRGYSTKPSAVPVWKP